MDNTWRMWCHHHPPLSLCGPSWSWSQAASHSHLAGAMPQELTLASLGRSKPNSLSEGTDNDIFIPYWEQLRSFSFLFAHLAPCQAPSPGSPWKDGNGSGMGGLAGVHTLASWWEMPSLMWALCFMSCPNAEAGQDINRISCSSAPRPPGWGGLWHCHLPCTRCFHNPVKVSFFI